MPTSSRILSALADLAPAGRRLQLDSTSQGPFAWLGLDQPPGLLLVDQPPTSRVQPSVGSQVLLGGSAQVRRLAAIDALHRQERLLRLGWVLLAGTATVEGAQRRILLPLVSRPVRLRRVLRSFAVSPAGDLEAVGLVTDPAARRRLEEPQVGGGAFDERGATSALVDRLPALQGWIRAGAAAAGFDDVRIVGPERDPRRLVGEPGISAVVGCGLFLDRDVAATDVGSALRAWSTLKGLDATAFAAVYGVSATAGEPAGDGQPTEPPAHADDDPVRSPLPLTAAQREVIAVARRDPVTVLTGAPGTGKSHTLVATAVDAVDRGSSVLVATQSVHAAEVLADLFDREAGPMPVRFGSSEHRDALLGRLSAGLPADPDPRDLAAAEQHALQASARAQELRGLLRLALDREHRAARRDGIGPLLPGLRAAAPGAFSAGADPDELAGLLDELQTRSGAGSTWQRWRARRVERRLRRRLGAEKDVGVERLRLAVEAAGVVRAAAELASDGGTRLVEAFAATDDAEGAAAAALGELIEQRSRRVSARGRRAASGLASALRAGRSQRRELLARLDGDDLAAALPLWIGTLADIEDLLPRVPGLFDVVILDEASQIDQLRAAPALLRGRRALVAGDPRQLRHVSFVADVDVATGIAEHDLGAVADRLDVRRTSALDLAAGAAPARWLDEHFRSSPHLIAFSAERFYRLPIHLVTRHPRNERSDAIDVVHVGGSRDAGGVNAEEVRAVADVLRLERATGVRSIGIVSPFRAQADALEAMVLAGYDLEAIERFGLRTGTVHQLQGSEHDVVVCSLALAEADPPAARRFLEDPNLFNVLITRARRRMVVVTSLPSDTGGLVGDYLAHADATPAAPGAVDVVSGWARAVHDALVAAEVPVRAGYPVGRWRVDLVVGQGDGAVAVDTDVHLAGPEAHLARHLTLRRAGWRLADAYDSRYGGDAQRAAVDLAATVAHS